MAKSSIETSFQNLVNVIKDKTYPATSGAAVEADIADIKIDITNLGISKIGISQIGISGGVAPTNHTHTKSQITDFPESMPASDVHAWAKAANKPDYTPVEIGAIAISQIGISGGVAPTSHTHTTSDITNLDLTPYQLQQMASAVTIAGSSYTDVEPAIRALSENESDLKLDIDNLGISKIGISQIGISGGVASLDANGKVPSSQLPDMTIPVTSVNNKTGDVELTPSDIGAIGISQVGMANGVAGLNSEGKLDFGDIDTDIISKADLEDMWDGEDLPNLPSGYTMLSYIQNTDAQWINTGVSVTEDTSADLIGLTPVEASRYGTFLGEGDQSGRIWSIRYKADSGVIQFQLGDDNKAIDGPTLVNGSEYNVHAEIGKLVVNGTEYTGSGQSLGVPISTLRIFDNGSGERARAKLFRCKIYESGVLIRDFIAAKRSTDNAIGMYDVVNNTFYGNDGNGDFTAGSPIGTRASIGDSSTFENLIDIIQHNMLGISQIGISGGVAPTSHTHTVSDITNLDLTPYQLQQMASAVTIAGSSYTDVEPAIRALSENESNLKLDIDNLSISKIGISQIGISGGVASLGNDGKVPSSQLPAMTIPVTSVNNKTGDVVLTSSDIGAIGISQVGMANGVASLDANGKVPTSQLPSTDNEKISVKLNCKPKYSDFMRKYWSGFTNFNGSNIWTDGTDIYCSRGTNQYVLDKATSTWTAKTWSGLTSFYGSNIWTDGTDIYFSNGTNQYVLNKATSTWTAKTWSGLTNFYGENIWTDGTDIYYSDNTGNYVLNKATSTWTAKTWSGRTTLYGSRIWTDGTDIYFSYGADQYVLDKATSTWTAKTWSGLTNFYGSDIWTDGTNIYFSDYSIGNYVLNKATSTWTAKTWSGRTSFYGSKIWTDGTNIYLSDDANQYDLVKD